MATKYRVNSETCVACGVCVEVCPVAAISADPYAIDPIICNACGECVAVCPTEAIEEYEYTPPPYPPAIVPVSFSQTMQMKIE
jgi:MinD superfamily P-loop ATPase